MYQCSATNVHGTTFSSGELKVLCKYMNMYWFSIFQPKRFGLIKIVSFVHFPMEHTSTFVEQEIILTYVRIIERLHGLAKEKPAKLTLLIHCNITKTYEISENSFSPHSIKII